MQSSQSTAADPGATSPAPIRWEPSVSVVIPALDEEHHIVAAVRSALDQNYPRHLVEVIVADGGSSDATRAKVGLLAVEDGRVRLIDNPGRNQASGLNHAIRASGGAVIARLDAHAVWPPSHLRRCMEILERTGADNVGGTMEAIGSTPVGEAVALATRTRLGAGGAEYRIGGREREVDTVYLGCFRREVFERVGMFDELLPPHEDYELNRRIRATGGKIIFSPDLPTQYSPRGTWRSLAHQYYQYGRAKVRASGRTSGLIRPHHLLPPALVLSTLAMPILATRRRWRFTVGSAVAIYITTCLLVALRVRPAPPPNLRLRLTMTFPVIHLSWGLGFWAAWGEVALHRVGFSTGRSGKS